MLLGASSRFVSSPSLASLTAATVTATNPMITDKAIQSAILSVSRGADRSRELADPSERGGGSLILRVRPAKARVSAEFIVRWQHVGTRRNAKLGAYPSLSLADARRIYRTQYLPVILKGESPVGPRAVLARGRGTVSELFQAYVDHLGERPQAKGAAQILLGKNGAAIAIGPNRPAAAVRPHHVKPHLAEIFERGAVCQANNVRNIIHAAFAYGIRSANSYFDRAGAVDWGLEFNPISAIPSNREAYKPRDRALSPAELKALWRWIELNLGTNRALAALQLEIATGQRACEILRLKRENYDPQEQLLTWKTTKNGRPHCIPLPNQAIEILEVMAVDGHGHYFPARHLKSENARSSAISRLVRRYIRETGAEPFEARDLRRTWKTLAGAAGLSKSIRDRLQNHALGDVSSKHYDKWEYLPEKREAMARWSEHLDQMLANEPTPSHEVVSQEVLDRLAIAMGSQLWRGSAQARHHRDWVGYPIADAIGLPAEKGWKELAWQEAVRLVQRGAIARIMVRDHKARQVPAFYFSSPVHEDVGAGAATPPQRRFGRASILPPMTDEGIARLADLMGDRVWRASPQALRQPDWIGIPVAKAFDLGAAKGWKTKANRLARELEMSGILVRGTGADVTGREVPTYQFRVAEEKRHPPRLELVESPRRHAAVQGDLFGGAFVADLSDVPLGRDAGVRAHRQRRRASSR